VKKPLADAPATPAAPVRSCVMARPALREKLASFLKTHGDDLPEAAIKKATSPKAIRTWTVYCDDKNEIAAAMRYEHNDWYLCTVKNAAVRPDLRGKGIGSKLYVDTAAKAHKNPSCLVLAADVTSTNTPSVKALERAGFTTVNRFCWNKDEKPADIMHYVKMPAHGTSCKK